MMSKAALRSRESRIVDLPLSIAVKQLSIVKRSAVSVEWLRLYAD